MAFWLSQYLRSTPPNFGQVSSSVFRGAQPDKHRLEELRDRYGVQAILNLRDDNDPEEQAEVEAAGLLWYPVPMSDKAAPTDEEVRAALAVLSSGVVTHVSCKGGRHRTGLICACYLVVVKGQTKEVAWQLNEARGWYDAQGHKPLRLWFEQSFDPVRFR